MTSRERVRAALSHTPSDRVPADLGGGPATLIHPSAYTRLVAELGVADEGEVSARGQGQVLRPSEACLQQLAVDVRGAVASLIPDFIDAGVQVLNPVQVSAAGMDTLALKREYGRDLAFCGAIDTHRVLPRGSPADVTAEVRKRIDDFGADGEYVIASVHNIQAETPAANIVAMFSASREGS